ncbi:HAD family hydrolase [Candidatus Woesearchaeota archaeon]|nr:HAD family hydrolase [Candidatus Woesearchaeota archaeon]
MIELIIFDLHGTIVAAGDAAVPRNGFYEFLDKYADRTFVIATDAPLRNGVLPAIERLAVQDNIAAVYAREQMVNHCKDFQCICSDFGVPKEKTVFITDGGGDLDDALAAGIKVIHVPYYMGQEEPFSFALIDLTDDLPPYLNLQEVNDQTFK